MISLPPPHLASYNISLWIRKVHVIRVMRLVLLSIRAIIIIVTFCIFMTNWNWYIGFPYSWYHIRNAKYRWQHLSKHPLKNTVVWILFCFDNWLSVWKLDSCDVQFIIYLLALRLLYFLFIILEKVQ